MNILTQEYSDQFDKLRKNRVEVSFYKYGSARDNFASGRVDAIGSLELCLDKFRKQAIQSIYLMLLIMQCSGICILCQMNFTKQQTVPRAPER